jgi:hypothetical protein
MKSIRNMLLCYDGKNAAARCPMHMNLNETKEKYVYTLYKPESCFFQNAFL